ncbi:hypothetical protein FLONG3_5322 [Fusarium longipes]|uniref:Heterokaryon incompatibility domain-containing protein n=1 Tax=Fusarium longipes TaxID=694270 RepID=A0A395SW76_9HYPO|nr:hypothetical protein FLONG3_5322 [Fusarium longipes]
MSEFRVWADALCINQEELLERTHQVGLMADIYSSASIVFAWLSSNDRDVEKGFQVLNYIPCGNPCKRKRNSAEHGVLDLANSFEVISHWLLEYYRKPLTRLDDLPRIDNLSRLWKVSFWSRVWTQQEVILAKRLYCISPKCRMDSYDLYESNAEIERFLEAFIHQRRIGTLGRGDQYSNANSAYWIYIPTEQIAEILQRQRGVMGLLSAKFRAQRVDSRVAFIDLYLSGHLQATDNLDYVYGLLAVTKAPIIPDYTKSLCEVYMEFVHWVIDGSRRISERISPTLRIDHRLLGFLDEHAVGIRQTHGLPTWGPVFSPNEKRKLLNFASDHFSSPWNHPYIQSHYPLLICISGASLWTGAAEIQTIKAVYDEPISEYLRRDLPSFVQGFLDLYGRETYINDKPIFEILCCTILLRSQGNYNAMRCSLVLAMDSPDFRAEELQFEYGDELNGIHEIIIEWRHACRNQSGTRIFITEDYYVGLVREEVQAGDIVFLVAGCRYLTILRPVDDHYLFVDSCFILGLMDGQVNGLIERKELKIRTIERRRVPFCSWQQIHYSRIYNIGMT